MHSIALATPSSYYQKTVSIQPTTEPYTTTDTYITDRFPKSAGLGQLLLVRRGRLERLGEGVGRKFTKPGADSERFDTVCPEEPGCKEHIRPVNQICRARIRTDRQRTAL
jgi:hypothetical protein